MLLRRLRRTMNRPCNPAFRKWRHSARLRDRSTFFEVKPFLKIYFENYGIPIWNFEYDLEFSCSRNDETGGVFNELWSNSISSFGKNVFGSARIKWFSRVQRLVLFCQNELSFCVHENFSGNLNLLKCWNFCILMIWSIGFMVSLISARDAVFLKCSACGKSPIQLFRLARRGNSFLLGFYLISAKRK